MGDFAGRLPPKILNKKLLESLGKAGALDSFVERRTIVEQYDRVVAYAKGAEGAGTGQASLLDGLESAVERASIEWAPAPPATPQQKLEWEKETLGLYVSSHPLAGLKKYIARKAQMIEDLTSKNVGKKATLAGIVESVKKLRTKKGDTMAIVMLEDPTGKMEVTLFPKTYADAAAVLEQPDTVLVVSGVIDQRVGQLQMKVDAVKRSSLSMMIQRAKDDGMFDEEEAKRGLTRARREEEDQVDHVDEEGDVVAGAKAKIAEEPSAVDELHGPVSAWVLRGMPAAESMEALGLGSAGPSPAEADEPSAVSVEASREASSISLHTVALPPRAPKQLLLDLKDVFLRYPGPEKVQLKIGEQLVALPVTVTMSPLLQQRNDEVLDNYAAA
jgi:DNA polymerase III alpha subunit